MRRLPKKRRVIRLQNLQRLHAGPQLSFTNKVLAAPAPVRETYLESSSRGMDCYGELCAAEIGHDAAGYATAQRLRNVLLISATPYQWKHIIGQRICRRNTDETLGLRNRLAVQYFYFNPVYCLLPPLQPL